MSYLADMAMVERMLPQKPIRMIKICRTKGKSRSFYKEDQAGVYFNSCQPVAAQLYWPGNRANILNHMDTTNHNTHILEQSFPSFLHKLEYDYQAGINEFASYAYKMLECHPPRPLASQTADDRLDIIQSVILHFIENNGKRLRSYRDTGKPFSRWFVTVAYNKVIEIIRENKTWLTRYIDTLNNEQNYDIIELVFDPFDDPSRRTEYREVIAKVRQCMRKLERKCRILINAHAQGFNFTEIGVMAGLGPDNKRASDTLRACRTRLKKLLFENGIDIGLWIPREKG